MTIIWSLILVNVFMGLNVTNQNDRFTYHEIQLKKTATKKLLGITIDKHLNFNQYLADVCKRASRKPNALSRASSFLSYQQRKIMVKVTLSSVDNSTIVLLFGYLVLSAFREKSANYMRGFYVYVIMITPQAVKIL